MRWTRHRQYQRPAAWRGTAGERHARCRRGTGESTASGDARRRKPGSCRLCQDCCRQLRTGPGNAAPRPDSPGCARRPAHVVGVAHQGRPEGALLCPALRPAAVLRGVARRIGGGFPSGWRRWPRGPRSRRHRSIPVLRYGPPPQAGDCAFPARRCSRLSARARYRRDECRVPRSGCYSSSSSRGPASQAPGVHLVAGCG